MVRHVVRDTEGTNGYEKGEEGERVSQQSDIRKPERLNQVDRVSEYGGKRHW